MAQEAEMQAAEAPAANEGGLEGTLVDALPYIDTLANQGWKAQADMLIQEEIRNSAKTPQQYLADMPPVPPPFQVTRKLLSTVPLPSRRSEALCVISSFN